MPICLDISAGLGQGAGIGRYARELSTALTGLADRPDLVLFHNRQPLDRLPATLSNLPRQQVPLSDREWRLFLLTGLGLPAVWRKGLEHCNLFHGLDSIAPPLSCPTVLTIHDLSTTIYPQHHTRLHRLFARISLPHMVRRASAIIADSNATSLDIIQYLKLPSEKVHTIYLGVDHNQFHPLDQASAQRDVEQALGISPPFILAVGTLEPRKNLVALLRAYSRLDKNSPILVLVGARGWGSSPLFDIVRELGLQQRVRFTGYIQDALLPSLYAGAEFFVYPSLYEGFGLPVLEALACGAAVITSNVSSLPEVAGEAAWLVNPAGGDELVMGMEKLLADTYLRESLRAAGPQRARDFTWEKTARQTMDVYRQVLQH